MTDSLFGPHPSVSTRTVRSLPQTRRDTPMININTALSSVVSKLRSLRSDDTGATAVEYCLMVALIAAVIAGVVLTLGNTLHDKFSNVSDCVASNGSTHCAPTTGSTP